MLQGTMGKMERKQKENHATKVTKIPKNQKMKWDERKKSHEKWLLIFFDL